MNGSMRAALLAAMRKKLAATPMDANARLAYYRELRTDALLRVIEKQPAQLRDQIDFVNRHFDAAMIEIEREVASGNLMPVRGEA